MATATEKRNGAAAKQQSARPIDGSGEPLGIKVEVFGATGKHGSGKTVLGLTIAPGPHSEGHPFAGRARTLYLDWEKSGGCYEYEGLEREDVPTILLGLHPNGYRPIDSFLWFRERIKRIEPGRYDLIHIDPITDIEEGLVDYVKANPAEFGYTPGQFQKAQALVWGAVKSLWKRILADLAARTKVFYFVAHLKREFKGDAPTSKFVPKGKGTLMELASLYLEMDREPTPEGQKPAPPSAKVLKDRLSRVHFNPMTGELETIKVLPDRLPEATAKAIRHYAAHPVGGRKLKEDEVQKPQEMTAEEKAEMELEIATRRAEEATANLQRTELLERMRNAPGPMQAAVMVQPAAQTANSTATLTIAEQRTGGITIDTADPKKRAKVEYQLVSDEIAERIRSLLPKAYDSPADFRPVMQHYGVHVIGQFNPTDAAEVLADLERRAAERQSGQRTQENAAPPDIEPQSIRAVDMVGPCGGDVTITDPTGPARPGQIARLEKIIEELQIPINAQREMQQRRGIGSWKGMTQQDCTDLFAKLLAAQQQQQATPKN
jgi:hypothetical protein